MKKFEIKMINGTTRSSLINMSVKPISMVLSLVYTPLLLSYLGDEKYGLWATLLSIISWINYFDVGIGNGLRNILTKEISENRYEEAKKSVSTAYCVLTCISATILFLLIILTISMEWKQVFNTDIDMKLPLMISFIFICINFVMALCNTLLYSLQMAEVIAIRGVIAQAVNLIGLIILKQNTSSNLVYVSILFGSGSMVIYLFNSFGLFTKYNYLRPDVHYFSKNKIADICQIGIKFFVIQIMGLVLFTVDDLLISHYFGAISVTPFSIANKVFHTAYTVFAAFLVPYWSRATVAFSQCDSEWITRSLKNIAKVFSLFIIGFVMLLLLFDKLVSIWMGRHISFDTGIPTLMCIFYLLYSILGIECQFINGSGQINKQLVTYIIAGISNIPLSIFLGVTCGLGSFGVRLASTLLVFAQVIFLGFNLSNIIKSIKQ